MTLRDGGTLRCEVLDEELLHDGFITLKRYRLQHELFEGGQSRPLQRELVIRADAVGVLPYDAVRDEIVLIEQFRVGAMLAGPNPWMLELVAGLVEPGEAPETVATREAEEEAAASLGELEPVFRYFSSPGGSSERFELFIGQVSTEGLGGVHGLASEGEDIRVHVFSVGDALALMEGGGIVNAHTLIALQWLAMNRERLRARWA